MSAINQMLRDLDQRGALAPGGIATPAVPSERPAGDARAAESSSAAFASARSAAFASARMSGAPARVGRQLLLAAGVAALLPIAWATNVLDPLLDRHGASRTQTPAEVPAERAVDTTARTATVIEAAPPTPSPVAPAAAVLQTMPTVAAVPQTMPTVADPTGPTVTATTTATGHASASANAPDAPDRPTIVATSAVAAPVQSAAIDDARAERRPETGRFDTAAAGVPSGERPARAAQGRVTARAPTPGNGAAEPARRDPPPDARLALAIPSAPKDETRIERRPSDTRDDLAKAGEAMSIGRTSDAIALLNKVIQAEPANEKARLALLSLLAERGRDDTWRHALADSARALPQRFGLAAARGLAESGRFDQSLAILQGLPASVRDVRYWAALGATHQQLNQHAEAVAAFDTALGTAPGGSPQLPSLLVAQALSMQSLGKLDDARRNLERVRQMPEAAADVREFASRELAHRR